MVTGTGWRVEVRDETRAVIGVCDVYTQLKMTLKHRKAGAWTLTLPAGHPQAGMFTEGCGIIVWAPWDDAQPLMSGTAVAMLPSTPTNNAPAYLSVNGIDDLALLADRLVMPDPTKPLNDQDAAAYWTYTNKAEGVIRKMVDVNAGAGAIVSRRFCVADPYSRLANSSILVGSTTTVAARFDTLLSMIDTVGLADNLRVRMVQPRGSQELHLDVTLPQDVSDRVRLSQHTGTLTSATAVYGAPGATTVLVAGGGEGTARVLVERSNSTLQAQWGRRIEMFRDARDTVDLTELAKRGDETLIEAAGTASVSLVPLDTPYQRYGYDYGLGDTISVEVGDLSYTDIVTAVEITLEAATGATVVPAVGDTETSNLTTPVIYQRVRELMRRLDSLERRK